MAATLKHYEGVTSHYLSGRSRMLIACYRAITQYAVVGSPPAPGGTISINGASVVITNRYLVENVVTHYL
jgi:hypothetical protein